MMTKERIIEIIKDRSTSISMIKSCLLFHIELIIMGHLVEKYMGNITMWEKVLGDDYIKIFSARYLNFLIFKLRGNE